MSGLRTLIVFALVLSICCPLRTDDWSAPWFIEDKEETNVEKPYEGESFPEENSPGKLDFTNEKAPDRNFRRFSSLLPVTVDIRHAPIYLLVASLRR